MWPCDLFIAAPLYSQDRILQAMGNVTLALHLLCERANPASFWLPYIRSLPQEYDIPLYYQQEDVQLLLGTQAVQDVLSQYKNTARQYAYFYKLVQVGRYTKQITGCQQVSVGALNIRRINNIES